MRDENTFGIPFICTYRGNGEFGSTRLMLPKDDMLRMETFLLFDCSSRVAIVYSQIPTERGFL